MRERILGLDLGAETVKVAELVREGSDLRPHRTWSREHGKDPARALADLLVEIEWASVTSAAVTGRMARALRLEPVPVKVAIVEGLRLLYPALGAATVVSIGGRGFSVTEVSATGAARMRESSRCSQGTGNFLRQLVERLGLDLPSADRLCEDATAAPLSGRCPVILKTDLTHLANKGVERRAILAGLYDAVCENVVALVRPHAGSRHLVLIGGVARSARVRRYFGRAADRLAMTFVDGDPDQHRFLEAFGAAHVAACKGHPAVDADRLFRRPEKTEFERLPGFRPAMTRVHRMRAKVVPAPAGGRDVMLGLDIGSTGSKGVALDLETDASVWEYYTSTSGDPVAASQRIVEAYLDETPSSWRVPAVGVTGSGREIVGSLLASCFGVEPVFVLNEIAAHARGALYHDPAVDTIFEIGGQDAKYIRLDGGRICDAAMNEACSAGTGSFIEEQGRRFDDVDDVAQMAEMAAESDRVLSLGQHCSVFMAEVIDQAVAAGEPSRPILAGIYDSVVQNYLNRVKGARSVGARIFCQGMPFLSDALAASVARRTGRDVVVPPNPGTIGALGIALLARDELHGSLDGPLALGRFLDARVVDKGQFVCRSTKGCGGGGNACRIDRLRVAVAGRQKNFLWGGSCSLFDRGTRRRKLPDRAPEPFREREALIEEMLQELTGRGGRPRIALTDQFGLKGLLPFFATYLHELGFDLEIVRSSTRADLKGGIQRANVPYCAPMQLFHGLVERMLEREPDWLFAPMVIDLPRSGTEPNSSTCPVVQASPGIIAQALLRGQRMVELLDPTIEMGAEGLESDRFLRCCRELAARLGARRRWQAAYGVALRRQESFQRAIREIGRRALTFAREHEVSAVVVLGRAYTIYNPVLNSNVPPLLRELGALAVPVDCYPLDPQTPSFDGMFWHYGQLNLRAAHQIRRTAGVYSVYCSNYACGPDSFNLQFYGYVMENKPFALIETDGHTGDAGTKTRLEAFLYCVESDRRSSSAAQAHQNDFRAVESVRVSFADVRADGSRLLIPRMGPGAHVFAALMRGEGVHAEALAESDEESLAIGRRHTTGKECLPMALTAGALLRRLAQDQATDTTFAFLMPTTCGPCRFGAYNLLHSVILQRTGWDRRVRIVSPHDHDYFAGLPENLTVRLWMGFVAMDLLLAALHHVRPVASDGGAAEAVYAGAVRELLELLERPTEGAMLQALREARHDMFGMRSLVRRAAVRFAEIERRDVTIPTVGVVGEIYVRLDPFANSFVIERLEKLGVRARLAPLFEWTEFTSWWRERRLSADGSDGATARIRASISRGLQDQIAERLYVEVASRLGWEARTTVPESVATGELYVNRALASESILTVGGPLHEYLRGEIDGVVSVGPLECMPNKIAESHLQCAERDFGLPSLTLSLNGDPLDQEQLEAFVYEVKERAARADRERARPRPTARSLREAAWQVAGRGVASVLGSLPR